MRTCSAMPYHTGIRLRIYPNYRQRKIISVNAGVSRFVYNRLVALNNERFELSKGAAVVPCYKERLSYIDSILRNPNEALPAMIKNSAPFLYGDLVDSLAVDNAIINYRKAWKKFREDPHAGIPDFHRKGYEQSYQTNAHYRKTAKGINDANVRFEDKGHMMLPILGRIRVKGSEKRVSDLLGRVDTRIGTVRVLREADGRYFISLQIASEQPFAETLASTGAFVGIDLNLDNFLWDSDNHVVANPKDRRSSQEMLEKKQRCMSRKAECAKKEGRKLAQSKNYQKDRKSVAHLHAVIKARGNDFRHRISKEYIENQDIIFAEDLKVKNLLKNHRLALAISEAGWSDFLAKMDYKARMYGKMFIKVPPQFTTQTCSVCGYVLSGNKKLQLSDREWICPNCGTYHIRDHNAAAVILNRGLKIFGA